MFGSYFHKNLYKKFFESEDSDENEKKKNQGIFKNNERVRINFTITIGSPLLNVIFEKKD